MLCGVWILMDGSVFAHCLHPVPLDFTGHPWTSASLVCVIQVEAEGGDVKYITYINLVLSCNETCDIYVQPVDTKKLITDQETDQAKVLKLTE